ncbi:MAG TPA: hypothetical protein VFS20_20555, partial [Longimicrobium sp.]|nr:hypothetical protein [Longimicrobium sp.]
RNSALAVGRLIPLTTGNDAVTAYVRRDGDTAVLVMGNLGNTPAVSVPLTSAAGALKPGRYTLRSPLGGPPAVSLTVQANGQVTGYIPVRSLAPKQVHVWELTR